MTQFDLFTCRLIQMRVEQNLNYKNNSQNVHQLIQNYNLIKITKI